MNRRRFLQGLTGGLAGALLRPQGLFAAAVSAHFVPEYAGGLGELLFVYDQCAASHLLREMVEIIRHAPAEARVHVLVSRALANTARQSLASYGLARATLLVSDESGLSGDWGRDIFQLGVRTDGSRLLGVPWFKAAAERDDLARGHRQLAGLAGGDLSVSLVPAAFEGGNLMTDVRDGRNVLFAGTTIAVETRALYQHYYGSDPGDDGVARILAEGFGADRVVWQGPRNAGQLLRQSRFGFHIDMGMTLVAPGVAVVARCDSTRLDEEAHRNLLREEAEFTLAALTRRETAGWPWPEGLELPRDKPERELFLAEVLRREQAAIGRTAAEFEGMADQLRNLGYAVHRLEADPRRVRRFQSHTNAIVTADRLLMPLFPVQEHVHGWILRDSSGRDRVDVELCLSDSKFDLSGDNLAAFRLYQSLHPDVRAVRDYFYLASGNVHCVVGRLS